MPKKQVTKAGTLRGAFNQAGKVGHHKALFRPNAHHAEVGVQGGERVVGNAGPRVGDGGDQGRFTRIGHAQQADVGEHLELKLEIFFVTGPTRCFLARRPVDRAFEAHIAKTAITTLGNGDHLTWCQQLEQHLAGFRIGNDGAHRHLERDVVAGRAKHI